MRRDRHLDFIPQEVLDKDPKLRQKVYDYRSRMSLIKRKEKSILKKEKEIDKLREDIRDLNKDLTGMNLWVDSFRKDFFFSVSLVSYKKGIQKKTEYFNYTISRKGSYSRPKNISLGNLNTLRKHLSEYYKDESYLTKKKSSIVSLLNVEGKGGDVYKKLFDMIMDDPIGFHDRTIGRDTLFPI